MQCFHPQHLRLIPLLHPAQSIPHRRSNRHRLHGLRIADLPLLRFLPDLYHSVSITAWHHLIPGHFEGNTHVL